MFAIHSTAPVSRFITNPTPYRGVVVVQQSDCYLEMQGVGFSCPYDVVIGDNEQVPHQPNLDSEDDDNDICLLYTSPSPRDATLSRMPSSA